MKRSMSRAAGTRARKAWSNLSALVAAGLLLAPATVWAQLTESSNSVCTFFKNINAILNIASIAVVTIAVIFAGYQIAFAHKRIADVAPILIGGLLIGAAAQIAKMLIPNGGDCVAMVVQALPMVYA